MFLVLMESVENTGKGWTVVAHGPAHIRSISPTREEAEKFAVDSAKTRKNKFAVVEIKSWFQQEVPPVEVRETVIG